MTVVSKNEWTGVPGSEEKREDERINEGKEERRRMERVGLTRWCAFPSASAKAFKRRLLTPTSSYVKSV
jgi:hypothetical protein